jgi:DNA-directed RNA polymerase subunit beta
MTQPLPTISFAKLQPGMPMPHLLDIQTRSFDAFLRPVEESEHVDMSLERVFQEVFPIADVNGNYSL